MEQRSIQEGKLKVFVSYSREDIAFADELVSGLEHGGFETTIDRHSIAPGEDWRVRLGGLILAADTVIFILSPGSIKSEICAWEIQESRNHSKRVIPVIWKQVDFSKVPLGLSTINAISFDNGRLITGLRSLIEALNSDLEWLRQHTKLAMRSEEWSKGGKGTEWLLRGNALIEAQNWLSRKPKNAPESTKQQLSYIEASEAEEARLLSKERVHLLEMEEARLARERAEGARKLARRTLIGITVTSALAIIATASGIYALRLQREAVHQSERAEQARNEAIEARNETFLTTSKFVAEFADTQTKIGDSVTGMLLALEALPNPTSEDPLQRDRPYFPDAAQTLINTLKPPREQHLLHGHHSPINGVFAVNDDRNLVTTSSDGVIQIWDLETLRILKTLYEVSPSILTSDVSRDGQLLATSSADSHISLWNIANTSREEIKLETVPTVTVIRFSPDQSLLLLGCANGSIALVDRKEMKLLEIMTAHNERITDLMASADGHVLISSSGGGILNTWDLKERRVTGRIRLPDEKVTRLAILDHLGDAAGRLVVTGSSQGDLRIWGATTGELKATLKGHAAAISDIVELPGFGILTSSRDGTMRIWDGRNGQELHVMRGHLTGVLALAISENGKRAFSGSEDSTIRIWSLPDLQTKKDDNAALAPRPVESDKRPWLPDWAKPSVYELRDPALMRTFVEGAVASAPRCFTEKQRKDYVLRPEPQDWCLKHSKWPHDAMTLLKEGRLHALQNRDQDAMTSFSKYLELDFGSVDAVDRVWSEVHLRRAKHYLKNRNYEMALGNFEISFQKNPDLAKRYASDVAAAENGLAWKLLLEERAVEALPHAEKAVALDSLSAAYIDTRAHALQQLGRTSSACADFHASTSIGSIHPSSYLGHGMCLEQANDERGAIGSYERAVQLEAWDQRAREAVQSAKERLANLRH